VQKQTLRLPSSGSSIGPLSLDASIALAMLQVLSADSHLLTPHLNQKQQRRRVAGAEHTANVRFRLFKKQKPFQLAPVASTEAYLSLLHPSSRSPP